MVLKRLGWKRSQYVLSTKLFWGGDGVNESGLSRKHIVEGMNESLKRLQLDYGGCAHVSKSHQSL